MVYTEDLKSSAFWLAGSSPAHATKLERKKNMSWPLTQEQYREFIITWQRSATSCEALESLLESSTFPNEIELPYSSMYYGTYSNKLTRPKIQGIANALRQKGIDLKSLKIDPENRAKPKSRYIPGESSRHLDFDELALLVE